MSDTGEDRPIFNPELLRILPTSGPLKYTPQQRWEAALAWAVTGNATKASAICGIDHAVISSWIQDAAWWPIYVEHAFRQMSAEFDAKLTGMIDKAINVAMQQLDDPDISARDAAVIMGIAYDKRALHRGQATSRVERVNLGELRNRFAQVIDAQPVSNKDEGQTPSPKDSTG